MTEEQQPQVPTNAADATEEVNQQQAADQANRAERPDSLSTQRASENFDRLRNDDSVAVDERVPSGPLNPTVTGPDQPTDPARVVPPNSEQDASN